jgi:hypothetical protein
MAMKKTPILALMALVAACVTATGCLVNETENILYLDPDGSVAWVTLEKDIRSNEEDPEERRREEQLFLDAWARGEHEVAVEMAELGALSVDCQLVRPERPFMVVTSARFAAVDEALQRYFEKLEVRNEARLEWLPDATGLTWRIWVDDEADLSEPEDLSELESDDDPPLFRLVLTQGRFLDATGFEIDDDGTVATMPGSPDGLTVDEDGAVTLSLTWAP